MKNNNYIPMILLCIVIVLLLFVNKCNVDKTKDITSLYSAVISELEISENKLGEEVAKREIIQTNNIKDFLQLQVGQDSILMELQGLVKEYKKILNKGGSATIYEGETNIDKSSITNITYNNDSLPIYNSVFNDEWINYSIISKKDSTNLSLKVKNKYDIVIGFERTKIFKPKKPYVIVTNHNPYSMTKDLRTYQVKGYKPKRFGIGLSTGIGIGLNLKPQPYIGLGLNYSIIEL